MFGVDSHEVLFYLDKQKRKKKLINWCATLFEKSEWLFYKCLYYLQDCQLQLHQQKTNKILQV